MPTNILVFIKRIFSSFIISAIYGVIALLTPPVVYAEYTVTVNEQQYEAGIHVGGILEPSFNIRINIPIGITLNGLGLPDNLYDGASEERSLIQIQLPVREDKPGSGVFKLRAGQFHPFRFCNEDKGECQKIPEEGLWRAKLKKRNGSSHTIQLAIAYRQKGQAIGNAMGLFATNNVHIQPGDQIQLYYHGTIPTRSTTYTAPLKPRVRFRITDQTCSDNCWIMVTEEQIAPINIHSLSSPSYFKIIAPLDVAIGEVFPIKVVATDFHGNPIKFSGNVEVGGAVERTLYFRSTEKVDFEYRFQNQGFKRITIKAPSTNARTVNHWLRVSSETPLARRLLGDLQIHTGDGVGRTPFLKHIYGGDHAGSFSSAKHALYYLQHIAGYDFGAVTEHASRFDSYILPTEVSNDNAFQLGGDCYDSESESVKQLGDWWKKAQQIYALYSQNNQFTVFPAFEWHAHHKPHIHGNASLLHRVVLFKDFDENHNLPLLPGDQQGIQPQCLIRFLRLTGYSPREVMVIPHMMTSEGNIDWDLSYSEDYSHIANRELMEGYQAVGELYSARADHFEANTKEALTLFEGEDRYPGSWSYRYGWSRYGAKMGIIGGSDSHTQLPGFDNIANSQGIHSDLSETAATTIVLANSKDRDSIFNSIRQRHTYTTSGIRPWLDFSVADQKMGREIKNPLQQASMNITLASAQLITKIEVWGTRTDDAQVDYQLIWSAKPSSEFFSEVIDLENPIDASIGYEQQNWMYYMRAFFVSDDLEGIAIEDAAWTSPIWLTWENL
jgi:hypothetical protein